jgi:cyclopropane-fatty-acyl-phospholipid synthase
MAGGGGGAVGGGSAISSLRRGTEFGATYGATSDATHDATSDATHDAAGDATRETATMSSPQKSAAPAKAAAAAPAAAAPAAPAAPDEPAATAKAAEPAAPVKAAEQSVLVVTSPRAVRRLLWQPNELGLARAYVAGELEVEGDIWSVFRLPTLLTPIARRDGWREKLEGGRRLVAAARAVGALGPPLDPPPEEARLRGPLHSRARDAQAIAHHYDVSNDFYRLFLGETMTYSCAYFATPQTSLGDAQRAKYDLICRKLGLRPGSRLLDVGCGWGGMTMHAARHYGAQVVGVTVSQRQVDYARQAVAAAGLGDRVEIRLQDYRDVADEPFDAISSIGMFEHVGRARLGEYFARLHALLHPGGRLLNHGICRPHGSRGLSHHSFAGRYVFPDGELHEVGIVAQAMQGQGFEVRDDQSLREHYALTLHHWVDRLEAHWDEAVRLAGPGRARVWRLYMAGSAENFARANLTIHQLLAVRPHPVGASDMPLTRDAFLS